jgi:hypothetical protein
VKRRRFVALLLAVSGSAVVTGWVLRTRLKAALDRSGALTLARQTVHGLDETPPSAMSPETKADLWDIAEAVLPDGAAEAGRDGIMRRFEVRSETEFGYLSAVRDGLGYLRGELLGRRTGSLSQVPLAERRRKLERALKDGRSRSHWAVLAVAVIPALGPRLRSATCARLFVYEDILRGFFMSEAGWRVVGYARGPYSCAGIDAYAHRPEGVT